MLGSLIELISGLATLAEKVLELAILGRGFQEGLQVFAGVVEPMDVHRETGRLQTDIAAARRTQ